MRSHKIFLAKNCVHELWAYREMEQKSGTVLKIDAYQPYFRKWATKYLQEKPENVLAGGEPLSNVMTAKFGEGVSQISAERYKVRDSRIEKKF